MNGARPPRRQLDIEWIAMRAGLKPANRVTVSHAHADELEARVRRHGFSVVRATHAAMFPGRAASEILYVAPSKAYARALAAAEAPLLPPENATLALEIELGLHIELGRLLGFPSCCVSAFATRIGHRSDAPLTGSHIDEDFVAAQRAVAATGRALGRLNDLSPDRRARLVTFYPCRYDCPAAASYAAAVFEAASEVSASAAAALREALLGQMRIGCDGTRGPAARLCSDSLVVEFAEF